MGKKLYKNRDRKMLSGVLAGFSEYLDIDVTIVRIGYVVIAILTELFPLLVLYVIMAVLLPDKDAAYRDSSNASWRNEDPDQGSQRPSWKKDDASWKKQDTAYRPDGSGSYQDEPAAEPKETSRERYKKAGGSYIPKNNDDYGPEGYREIKEDDKN